VGTLLLCLLKIYFHFFLLCFEALFSDKVFLSKLCIHIISHCAVCRFDTITGFCVTADCGVTNFRVSYWGGWMDDGRVNVSADQGENCTCVEKERERERDRERERECSCLTMFIVKLLCIPLTEPA
jgi:hypothetical protein